MVKKEILISGFALETRVAIIEKKPGSQPRLVDFFIDRPHSRQIVGNIYKGKVANIIPGLNSAFVDIGIGKNVYLQVDDVVPRTKKIQNVLKPKADVMVQVTKESIGTKGPKATMDISLTGRFVVLLPFSDKLGVSKNITDKPRRAELKEMLDKYFKEKKLSYGAIVRTESADATADEIKSEIKYLDTLFKVVKNKYNQAKAPKLIYDDLDITEQIIRDYFTDEVEVLLTDSDAIYQSAVEYASDIAPDLKERIKLYKNKTPIFTAFNIEKEIENLLMPKVKLSSGGYIIIQEAESLCAIDVNSGKFLGSNLEETVTQTNIEAAREIARQIRLRNIGGIIVIDFIDMKQKSSKRKVFEAFNEAVKYDKAKVKIFPVTNLGLIEMSRSRKSPSLRALLAEPCQVCRGSGMVMSRHSILIKVNSELQKLASRIHTERGGSGYNVRIKLNPDVADYFNEHKHQLCINAHIQKDISLGPDEYHLILE